MENNDEAEFARWVNERLQAISSTPSWTPDPDRAAARLRALTEHARHSSHRGTWALAVATALFLCALSFPATRVVAQRCLAACIAQTSLVGKSIWQSTPPSTGLTEVSQRPMAPDFALPDSAGEFVRLSGFRSRVVVVNFWASWCLPCRTEIPWFIELRHAHGAGNLAIIGIAFDEDGWKSVRPFARKHGIDYPLVLSAARVAQDYGGVESLPMTFIIDKSGRIAARQRGLARRTEFEREIEALLAEK